VSLTPIQLIAASEQLQAEALVSLLTTIDLDGFGING
jgi:hypothetical protein